MLPRRVLLKRAFPRYARAYTQPASESSVDPTAPLETRLSQRTAKEPARAPFVKNLFLGKCDTEFLAYPEAHTSERQREYIAWSSLIKDYVRGNFDPGVVDRTGSFPPDAVERFKDLGLYRARVPEIYGGLELNDTEFTYLVEQLGAVPSLGSLLVKQNVGPIDLLVNYGSEEMRRRYLPRIASGELRPAICITEEDSGCNASLIKTRALVSSDGAKYVLTGCKTMVANANDANLFIVFYVSSLIGDKVAGEKNLSALVVERDGRSDGIVVRKPARTLGQRGFDVCDVVFNDIEVPLENQLGEIGNGARMLMHLFSRGRFATGAQAIAILKNFLGTVVEHVLSRKHFEKKMHEHQMVQKVVADMTAAIYAMESVTYMTTGMLDLYDGQDCELESAIVESYCASRCVENVYRGMQLIGAQCYREDLPYARSLRDALALTLYDNAEIDTHVYIALLGLQHSGLSLGEEVRKTRNPLYYPKHLMKQMFAWNTKLKLQLNEYLHPSLQVHADMLEEDIHLLKLSTQRMLEHYGGLIAEQQMDLRRLSEIAVEVYVLIAVISRASRSYCIGLRNADKEIDIGVIFSYSAFEKIKTLQAQLENGEMANGDLVRKSVGRAAFERKDYFFEHPLTKNY